MPVADRPEAVLAACTSTGTMLEINANPNRRDLNDVYARAAKDAGVPILIDSDAHGTNTYGVVRYGIATARRAWLGPEDVANTRTWKQFAKLRKPGRPT